MTYAEIALIRMRQDYKWLSCVEIGRLVDEIRPTSQPLCALGQVIGKDLFNRGLLERRIESGGRFGKYYYRVKP